MLSSDVPDLLTVRDLEHYPQPVIESHCLSDSGLRETGARSIPGDKVGNLITTGRDDLLFQLPPIHIDSLTPNEHLAFGIVGETGVVVLNNVALELLRSFQTPRPLDDGMGVPTDVPNRKNITQRFVEVGLLRPRGFSVSYEEVPPQVITAWIHVTNDCNLRCPYCFVHKSKRAMERKRGYQAIEAVFRSALLHGFSRVDLKYAGGEPLLNFSLILALHDYAQTLANEYDVTLGGVVLSNGVGLTDRMIVELQVRDLRLAISLDGVGEYHDAQRYFVSEKGSFELVLRALDRLAAHDFVPSISVTITGQNVEGLPLIIDFLLQRELPFTFNLYRENDRTAANHALRFDDHHVISAIRAAFRRIDNNLPPYSLLGSMLNSVRLDVPHSRACAAGRSYLAINHEGGVAKCHMELENPISDVSALDPLQAVCKDQNHMQNLPVERLESCIECSWRYWCAGECPALTYHHSGCSNGKSPNCGIYKALLPDLLRLEASRLLRYSKATVT